MKVFSLLFIVFTIQLCAQVEPLITDRPDITESAATLSSGKFQVESGFVLNNSGEGSGEMSINIKDISIFGTLLRYGISDRIELRLGSEYLYRTSEGEQDFKLQDFNSILAGTKIQLSRDNISMPDMALLLHLIIPAGNDISSGSIEPEAIFSIAHGLNDMFSLSYNLGGTWNSSEKEVHYLYSISMGISLSDRVGSFVEFFGEAASNTAFGKNADLGLTYLLADNFQADISAGINLDDPKRNWFLSTGVGFRLPE